MEVPVSCTLYVEHRICCMSAWCVPHSRASVHWPCRLVELGYALTSVSVLTHTMRYAEHEASPVPKVEMITASYPEPVAVEMRAVSDTQHAAQHGLSATAEAAAPQPAEKTLDMEAGAGKQHRVTADIAETLQELTASLEDSAAQVNPKVRLQ